MNREGDDALEMQRAAVLAGALAAAPSGATDRIVAIEDEPRHFLKFQNRHVRLFDVHLPPGYRGLFHSHVHDGVFVNVEASETVATDFGGEPVVRGPRQLGETYFFNYTKAPRIHRVDNTGATPFRVVDTEIHEGCGRSAPVEDAARPPILENDRVRVTRLLLDPGRSARLSPTCGMLVAVTGGRLEARSPGGVEVVTLAPAGFKWRDSFAALEVVNAGDAPFHGVDILVK